MNLKQYVNKELKIESVSKTHVKCVNCEGSGQTYRFEDRDPIEGYKMANKKVCIECNGSGSKNILDYLISYNKYLKDEEQDKELIKTAKTIKALVPSNILKFILKYPHLFKK